MLTDKAIRQTSKRRLWAVLPVMACAYVAMMVYFFIVGHFRLVLIAFAVTRFGESVRDITPIILIIPSFPIFLVPTIVAAQYAERFKTNCPSCEQDVTQKSNQLLATRCCPLCNHNIVDGGRVRSEAVYKRYLVIRGRSFLKYWFWAWPGLGLLCLTWHLFDDSAFEQCPQCYWVPPLIGASAAGWTWIRTFDRRYLPQFLSSVFLLVAGAMVFWYGV